MSVDTVFYIVGLVVTAGALIVSFAGLKMKDFPSRGALGGILAAFAALVVLTCGLAVAVAREEQDHRRQEQAAHAAEEADHASDEGETTAESGEAADEATTSEESDGGEAAAEGPGGTLQIAADPSALAYDKTELESAPGSVTIEFDNPSPIPHDVVVRGQDGEDIGGTDTITESTASVTLDLPAGEYQFYCSVPGHEQAGMVGTLKVG